MIANEQYANRWDVTQQPSTYQYSVRPIRNETDLNREAGTLVKIFRHS
jgi:hypothetical protein